MYLMNQMHTSKQHTVELGYSNIGFCDTLPIASNTQWYELIHKATVFTPCLVWHSQTRQPRIRHFHSWISDIGLSSESSMCPPTLTFSYLLTWLYWKNRTAGCKRKHGFYAKTRVWGGTVKSARGREQCSSENMAMKRKVLSIEEKEWFVKYLLLLYSISAVYIVVLNTAVN
jgi:hypothetical protein